MIDTLKAEQRLCNHLDRLPVQYDMDAEKKIVTPFDRIIFGASEYAKDGLIPIVEITGKEYPWFDRMRGIVDDIFKHARIDTPYGKIPSTNIEVNGELLQLLPRLFRMTGERKYLDWAHRLADYYLLPGKFIPTRLSDHGCEILGGLGLQLGAAPYRDGICIFLKSDKSYKGRLQFDIPRHRLYMGFKKDWPRMNAVPEWFTVEPDDSHRYKVKNVDSHATEFHSGKTLSHGLPVRLEPKKPFRLIVTPE
jgi:hypothetical protein